MSGSVSRETGINISVKISRPLAKSGKVPATAAFRVFQVVWIGKCRQRELADTPKASAAKPSPTAKNPVAGSRNKSQPKAPPGARFQLTSCCAVTSNESSETRDMERKKPKSIAARRSGMEQKERRMAGGESMVARTSGGLRTCLPTEDENLVSTPKITRNLSPGR